MALNLLFSASITLLALCAIGLLMLIKSQAKRVDYLAEHLKSVVILQRMLEIDLQALKKQEMKNESQNK